MAQIRKILLHPGKAGLEPRVATCLGPPVVPFYPFWGEGSPTKIDYGKRGNLSTGGSRWQGRWMLTTDESTEGTPMFGRLTPMFGRLNPDESNELMV